MPLALIRQSRHTSMYFCGVSVYIKHPLFARICIEELKVRAIKSQISNDYVPVKDVQYCFNPT